MLKINAIHSELAIGPAVADPPIDAENASHSVKIRLNIAGAKKILRLRIS